MSTDFGETWTDVTANLPSSKVTSIGVSANGNIVYAGTEEKGLFAAIDSSVGVVPVDTTTKTELGQSRGGGERDRDDKQGEYGRGHDNQARNNNAEMSHLSRDSRGEPPAWVKAIIMVAAGVILTLIVWLVVRSIKKRNVKSGSG